MSLVFIRSFEDVIDCEGCLSSATVADEFEICVEIQVRNCFCSLSRYFFSVICGDSQLNWWLYDLRPDLLRVFWVVMQTVILARVKTFFLARYFRRIIIGLISPLPSSCRPIYEYTSSAQATLLNFVFLNEYCLIDCKMISASRWSRDRKLLKDLGFCHSSEVVWLEHGLLYVSRSILILWLAFFHQ